ncbi:hypothetical protein [Pseudoalteromonas sp. bablab_jr011]|uniref:hypothetical protein n=1 Tax=Pseudoalteromonas sp. bablab_jr011 TaxID=2755062 RepID=UPI0018F6FD4B|nr:hypothetical protein [Pseudoalteromonas sp. bablab_jr011]
MNKKDLTSLFEKLYFHELNIRESTFTRVQINFAIFFTGYSIIFYMWRVLDFNSSVVAIASFLTLSIISILISLKGLYYLVRAFWGTEYRAVPNSDEINSYYSQMMKYISEVKDYNKNYPENSQEVPKINEIMSDFYHSKLTECSTNNSLANETRFMYLHNSIRWLLFSAVPFIIASIIFVINDLDTSSPRKEILIKDTSVSSELNKTNAIFQKFQLSSDEMSKKQLVEVVNQQYQINQLYLNSIEATSEQSIRLYQLTLKLNEILERTLKKIETKSNNQQGQQSLGGSIESK